MTVTSLLGLAEYVEAELMRAKASIVVIEGDPTVRSMLNVVLRRHGYDVWAEPNGVSFCLIISEFKPDLVIIESGAVEGPDGNALIRQLRETSQAPVLLLSTSDAVEDRLAAYESGGDDYMTKPFSVPELLARIEVLLRRTWSTRGDRVVGDLVIDDHSHTVSRGGECVDLTRTEYMLLGALAEHPGRVLTKPQLLSKVWGFDAYGRNVVEVHISALRRKLEAHGPRVIHTVRGTGYVLRT